MGASFMERFLDLPSKTLYEVSVLIIYLAPERKPGFFFEFKEGENFNC
jgi:hypothetical protein